MNIVVEDIQGRFGVGQVSYACSLPALGVTKALMDDGLSFGDKFQEEMPWNESFL